MKFLYILFYLAQQVKLVMQVNQSSVEAVEQAKKKQEEAEKQARQAEYQIEREKNRADMEIQRARRKAKSEIADMKENQFFWDWGYLCVIFFFVSSKWSISTRCAATNNDTDKLVQRIYSMV